MCSSCNSTRLSFSLEKNSLKDNSKKYVTKYNFAKRHCLEFRSAIPIFAQRDKISQFANFNPNVTKITSILLKVTATRPCISYLSGYLLICKTPDSLMSDMVNLDLDNPCSVDKSTRI